MQLSMSPKNEKYQIPLKQEVKVAVLVKKERAGASTGSMEVKKGPSVKVKKEPSVKVKQEPLEMN